MKLKSTHLRSDFQYQHAKNAANTVDRTKQPNGVVKSAFYSCFPSTSSFLTPTLAMQWEQQWLMAQLKWVVSDAERENILAEWGVVRATKRRKWQLVQRIWNPDFCE